MCLDLNWTGNGTVLHSHWQSVHIDFEVLNSVNYDAPPVVFPGTGKGTGVRVPTRSRGGWSFDGGVYSANKENIVITQIPFSSLGVTGTSSSKVKRGVTNDQDLLLDSL